MKHIDLDIYVGQNAKENWTLIDNANKDDIWYHLQSLPSPHVVCNNEKKKYQCALLCKQYSKYKSFKNIKVIYTPINNLIKGSEIGSVYFKSKRKVDVINIRHDEY